MYSNTSMSFEPNLKLATPINYILGPDDQIVVSIFGVQEYNGTHTVSPEGIVTIPNVGEVKLSGLTIEAATQKLKMSRKLNHILSQSFFFENMDNYFQRLIVHP